MTIEKLKELLKKYYIYGNVKLLSDSGWEVEPTEMNGIFYNEEENHIIFTQDKNDKKYRQNKKYKILL